MAVPIYSSDDSLKSILVVCGTRPEIVKLAPVYKELLACGWADPVWVHTGQHADMADQMLECFQIRPDRLLQRKGSSLSDFSTGCREQLERVLRERTWSAVIVQGDTESAFQGALAGFYAGVPVVHVEAGLRTYNLRRPFPEEALRQMISRISRLHMAPTKRAGQALLREGLDPNTVHVTGNTVVDAQLWIRRHHRITKRSGGCRNILVTMHRRENWGDDIDNVCSAVATIAREFPDVHVQFPVHLNPIVKEPVYRHLGGLSNVTLSDPLDYLAMQQALADAWLVLTDSGGLQEEAPTYGVPLLVLREETERPEVLDAGCAMLVGADRDLIIQSVRTLMHNEIAYGGMCASVNPFGDGRASQRIAAAIEQMLEPVPAPQIVGAR